MVEAELVTAEIKGKGKGAEKLVKAMTGLSLGPRPAAAQSPELPTVDTHLPWERTTIKRNRQ